MDQVIVFNQENGVPCILIPTQEALENHSIEDIAKKDVPSGKPFKIINASDLPSEEYPQESWSIDDSDLTDGFGSESSEFEDKK